MGEKVGEVMEGRGEEIMEGIRREGEPGLKVNDNNRHWKQIETLNI